MDCNPPGSSVYGILQARMLEWVAIPFSRGSSQPRNRTRVSCFAGRFFIVWATRDWISFNVIMTIWFWSYQSKIGLAKMRQFCEDEEDNNGKWGRKVSRNKWRQYEEEKMCLQVWLLAKWSEVKWLSHVQLFATPWTVAYYAPLSMGFSRQEYWSGLPFPSPEDLPDPGIKPRSSAL